MTQSLPTARRASWCDACHTALLLLCSVAQPPLPGGGSFCEAAVQCNCFIVHSQLVASQPVPPPVPPATTTTRLAFSPSALFTQRTTEAEEVTRLQLPSM